ncbi:MAG TPA: hypothetical protein VGN72_02365 [Tepidisphaeraceae bacterium]|jgi:tetratricopeptide (TPR) repeat protein|nr:hypothetical protein [Tepidisphaeraceae bacterium]
MPPWPAVRRKSRFVAVLLLACMAAAPTTRPDVAGLIDNLANRDPMVRATATKQLQEIGPPAREQLLVATQDLDPETRARAAAILAGMSLARPGDLPQVRARLEQYRKAEPSERQSIIERLARPGDVTAATVLMRILAEATSEEDRWAASNALISPPSPYRLNADVQRSIRELDTTGRNVPLLVAVGIAWQGRDSTRSNAILRRAVDIAAERGAPADEEVLSVLDSLLDHAMMAATYDDAAHLLRTQISLGMPYIPGRPSPAVELLGLHAAVGPLDGIAGDVRSLNRQQRTGPHALYAVAHLLQRSRRPLLAEGVALIASQVGEQTPTRRLEVGQLLSSHRHDRWARRELTRALERSPDADEYDGQSIDAAMRLALIAIDRLAYSRAAELLDQAIEELPAGSRMVRTDRTGRQQWVDVDQLRVEAAYNRLRAARLAGDAAGVKQQLDELMRLPLDDMDIVCDLLPVLRKHKRDAEAQDLFDRLYAVYKSALDLDPEHPEYLNNVAWFCARSGERPQEGVELATKAIATDKDNGAYLDTAAEAHFRVGNPAEAVRLERRALELRPNDRFMWGQLRRFERGLAQNPQ